GFKDGSEIRESVAVLWALSREGAEAHCFALDELQADVVNCLTGQPAAGESRNQLVEAARIARGDINPLTQLKAAAFDALVIPGGFGAAKNLCNFASKGSAGSVNGQVKRVLDEFHAAAKPIGAVCIAPAIVALAFPRAGFELTLGDEGEAAGEITKLGHKHVPKKASEWHCDRKNRIVSTPAYMHDRASLADIFTGVHGLVRELCGRF
ncbi:MAG: isoprenoid biosynthesis glyoxalase ElbB, partial [Bdellovibrionota bacterium]